MPDRHSPLQLIHRLRSGGAWALGGRAAAALTVLASNALLARMLSPQDLGAYFLAQSIIVLGAVLGSLGLNSAVVRFVAESIGLNQPHRTRRMISLTLGLGALGALGVGFLYLTLGDVLAQRLFQAPALAAITGPVAGWILVMSLQGLLAEIFRGFHDIRLATLFGNFGGMVSGGILLTALALLWSLDGRASLAAVVLLAAGSSGATALLASWILRRKVANLPASCGEGQVRLGEVWNVAWPLLISSATIYATTQADLWIVGAFLPQEEVAIYGAVTKLVLLVVMPLMIVNAVAPPLIAEMYAQGKKRELERTLRIIATLAGIPAFFALAGFISLGAPILGFVFGDYYRAGALALALLSLGQFANVCTGACGQTLTMTGHQVTMMAITIVSGVLTVTVCLLVVGKYGIMGVAGATAGGLVLQNASMLLGSKLTTGMWTHLGFRDLPKMLSSTREQLFGRGRRIE